MLSLLQQLQEQKHLVFMTFRKELIEHYRHNDVDVYDSGVIVGTSLHPETNDIWIIVHASLSNEEFKPSDTHMAVRLADIVVLEW